MIFEVEMESVKTFGTGVFRIKSLEVNMIKE